MPPDLPLSRDLGVALAHAEEALAAARRAQARRAGGAPLDSYLTLAGADLSEAVRHLSEAGDALARER